ncbi:polycomb group protein EMBRYONIC FLOWER 2 [Cajanus cajan]|uniref:polycomb group protein EMBRYONIC FLOWER 2 n=1 Tax=Cajanus cajan TaxID=3821 RepID=UPI00098DA858|nr:polycomb group protein EMBRYONIC FLOWER 2 [Cajanus cajan]
MPETSSARMPDAPVADSEKGKGIVNHQHDWEHLSAEEKHAAEESFAVYCKPVEFYNFLQHRANQYPLFLQRCLDYMIKAKRKKRIPLTVSLSWNGDETQSLFPLCICLARLDRNDEAKEGAKKYQAIRISTIHSSSKTDGNGNTEVQANFVLPELEKLHEEAKSSKFYVFIFASVENPISLSEVNASMRPWDVASNECGEICLYGKISMKNLHWIWDMYPKIPVDQLIRIQCRINLLPCIVMYCFQRKSKIISVLDSRDSPDERDLKQLEVTLSVRKLEDTEKSSYDTQANREVGSSSSLSNIHRLKQGNVSFNYRYYNNTLQKVEVTEDFSCPFCLVKCATFKGLRCHLSMSHDHFNYEFLELEDIPSVNVSVKTNIWKPEIIGDGVDPRIQTYIFCAKRPKRRDQSLLESEILASDTELLEKHDGSNAIVLHTGPDYVPPVSYQDHGTAAVLQVDQEGVSNAIVLHPGLDCVPPVSDHDHGMPAVLQVDQEGVSNAIILHPGPDCVPPISEHDNGTPAVPQVDKRSKLIVERRDPKIREYGTDDGSRI